MCAGTQVWKPVCQLFFSGKKVVPWRELSDRLTTKQLYMCFFWKQPLHLSNRRFLCVLYISLSRILKGWVLNKEDIIKFKTAVWDPPRLPRQHFSLPSLFFYFIFYCIMSRPLLYNLLCIMYGNHIHVYFPHKMLNFPSFRCLNWHVTNPLSISFSKPYN